MALGVTQQLPDRGAPHLPAGLHRGLARRRAWAAASPRSSCSASSSTGANNDLVGCTELARKMVREWGMSDRIGPMAWGSQGAVFLGEDLMHTRDYSDETARVIDEEVERILREQEDRCREAARRAPHRASTPSPGRCSSTRRSTAPRSPGSIDVGDGGSPGDRQRRRRPTPRDAEPGHDIGPGRRRDDATGADPAPAPPHLARSPTGQPGPTLSAPCSQPPAGSGARLAQLGDRGPQVGGRGRAEEGGPHDARRRRRRPPRARRRCRSGRAGLGRPSPPPAGRRRRRWPGGGPCPTRPRRWRRSPT